MYDERIVKSNFRCGEVEVDEEMRKQHETYLSTRTPKISKLPKIPNNA